METAGITPIQIPYPDAPDLTLRLTIGACRIRVQPGATDAWVSGAYTDTSGRIPCRVTVEGGTATIAQTPDFPDLFGIWDNVPQFDLTLGMGRPFSLTLETGASEAMLDLGGVPLTRLALRVGAGKYTVHFAAPNPQPMSQLTVEGGAAALELSDLANANFATMTLEGGAAGFSLDFGGTLQRDGYVKIQTGLAGIDLRIPSATPARVSAQTVLGGLDIGDGFMKTQGAFYTQAALSNQTPTLTIETAVALGGLNLRTV
ncbi:MAG: hypothetical protein KIT87_29315 [Anaerolineae bacterium]|nr:hypothetical protein [Anaerolineae bacterium]